MIMTISTKYLLKGSLWTIGAFGFGQVVRVVTSVVLAQLLAPDLFGIMLIVSSLRSGIELLSDVGIFQSMVYHDKANDPNFYNTAWTLGVIRSVGLWLIALVVAVPAAQFYQSPILLFVLPLTAFNSVLVGFTSVGGILLRKRLQVAKLYAFDIIVAFFSAIASILFAYLSRTVWALVFGGLFSSALTMIGSYFLLPDVRQKLYLSKRFAGEILQYGKWILVSSTIYFLASNFDRLYFAKVTELKLLGVYGIASSISALVTVLVSKLSNDVVFPFIAAHAQLPRDELREQVASVRAKFLLLAAIGFSIFIATADLAIRVLYDERYQAAAWMLPVLFIGSWFSMIANLNNSALLGLGTPSYNAIANAFKFVFILIALPVSVNIYGLLGGIVIVALADLCRYLPGLIGLRVGRFSFGRQDFLFTLALFFLTGLLEWLRWISGIGTSFGSLLTLSH